MKPLKGKIALVTGGSGGIGSAVCERLAADGAKVVVHYGGREDAAHQVVSKINDNGRIVNISSGLVVRPMPGFGLHVGSKAAVELMGKVLSMELGERGITVNTVSPGPTETEMFASSGDDPKAAAAQSPFNRLGQPEDIADVIAFVVSDKCRWITGHTFQAGGGYT